VCVECKDVALDHGPSMFVRHRGLSISRVESIMSSFLSLMMQLSNQTKVSREGLKFIPLQCIDYP
jgi:hypothetical protein